VATASREHPAALRVSGDIPAGSGQPLPLVDGTVARIMTGAPLPDGAEAVVPVEDTDDPRDQGVLESVRIFKAAPLGANVRPVGQEMRVGQLVLRAGSVLQPAAIGVLAALGIARVEVYRRPLIAIFSTGDELRELEAALGPGQIRDTNSYAVAAAIESYGGRVLRLGIARDQVDQVQAKLQAACEAGADLILSSAGVSV
jgi:molybdopterin molybdotransferase